jgi:TRAP-type mannitol/chloroaromatic compound transport system permease small subunit
MVSVIRLIDGLNEYVGRGVAWCTVVMVVIQFWIVIMRYVFAIGSIPFQESIWYLHGIVFMMGAGYTLLHGGHVRIDIFYREAPPRKKAWINLFGVGCFLLPVMAVTWYIAFPYVLNSWAVLEGSTEAGGLPLIFALKTVILIMVALFALQGISLALKSILVLRGRAAELGVADEAEVF